MLKIIENVDLYNDIDKYDLVLVGTNIYCNMSQGFQRKVMLNYPYVQDKNMCTKYGDETKLGTILECKKDGKPTFVLLYINKGGFRPDLKKDYLSYESLEKCLKLVNILYKGKNVACTILGYSKFEGNGDKEKIIKLIHQSTKDLNMTVYDYTQLSRSEEMKKTRDNELKLKEIDLEAYYQAVKKRKEEADERIKNNGHARY
jgi:hypothetical protein